MTMAALTYFSPAEKACVAKTFSYAEWLTERFFQIPTRQWLVPRYHVKTLAELQRHEVQEDAFAHLCKYSYASEDGRGPLRGFHRSFHFYRVCLQDHRILDAVRRGSSFIRLVPLMLYIATHELVHILRFERGESDFDMPSEERNVEERRVDEITRSILSPLDDPELKLVIECFGMNYRIDTVAN